MHFTSFLTIILAGNAYSDMAVFWILGVWFLGSIYGLTRLHKSASNQDSIGKGGWLAFSVVYLIMMLLLGGVAYIVFLIHAYSQVTDWR